jgi:LmbE family N-acetylglucosaminyl deacetylase
MRSNLAVPSVALAIAAHPDDVEFQCGGTLAKWAAQGCIVHHLICTDGAKGTWDVSADTTALVARRQMEQKAAAATLGATGEVVFLGAVDGELDATLERRGQVAYWIRTLRPQVVFGHDPWLRWRLHPDHRAAGFLACDGVVAARDPHFFPEHGIPHHRPDAILLFETEEPNHVEDVTGFSRPKIDALLAHVSQFETTMEITSLDETGPQGAAQRAQFAARIESELEQHGRLAGFRHGEAFRLIDEV